MSKSEGRRPKPERSPKAEIRNLEEMRRHFSVFDIRISFDLRISDFGFRRQVIFVTLRLTSQDFLDHVAMDIGQSPINSVVTKNELFVINAELMQNRGV